jgi:CheY-like chemotaxis protein
VQPLPIPVSGVLAARCSFGARAVLPEGNCAAVSPIFCALGVVCWPKVGRPARKAWPARAEQRAMTTTLVHSVCTSSSNLRILCVDDDPLLRRILQLNLLAEGHAVEVVGDGDSACVRAIAEPPDLILLDVMMPGRDGYSVLGELKTNHRTRDIPVVLLTAKASDEEIWEGWRAGADYYLTKPFDLDQLLYFVREVLPGEALQGGRAR